MDNSTTLLALLAGGHISLTDVRSIARTIFNGETTAAGPTEGGLEGYVITASQFDDLPEHVQGFVIKAILAFKVENVLEAAERDRQAIEAYHNEGNPAVDEDDNIREDDGDELKGFTDHMKIR